jgi:Ca2+-dependent lipid-binding protein
MELGEGILTIKLREGKLTHDTEFMGKMSPYCTITFKNQKFKTKIHHEGGKKPIWEDEFQLEVLSPTEELTLRCWDQDLTTSDAVGFTKIKMSSLIINCGVEDWFTIMFDNKPAGEILIKSTFVPKGGNQYEEMQKKHEE